MFEMVHVVGLFLGLLVVGVAMLRHRDLPRWAGTFVLVGMVGLMAAPGRPALAVATALLLIGLTVAAAKLARLPDELELQLDLGTDDPDNTPSKLGRSAHQGAPVLYGVERLHLDTVRNCVEAKTKSSWQVAVAGFCCAW